MHWKKGIKNMVITIKFSKDKKRNKYIFCVQKRKNKVEIDCNDLKLNAYDLYDSFFKKNNFNKRDTFKLISAKKKMDHNEQYIFDEINKLFQKIANELNAQK